MRIGIQSRNHILHLRIKNRRKKENDEINTTLHYKQNKIKAYSVTRSNTVAISKAAIVWTPGEKFKQLSKATQQVYSYYSL